MQRGLNPPAVCWHDEYFYRPAREVVREHIELSC